jgi:quercetin dioxygenase-like cupin family protein
MTCEPDEGNDGITFARIYASPDSETHFGDVTVDTVPVIVGPGRPGGAKGSPAAVTELTMLRMDPGYINDWHPAPRRQFVIVSAGEIEITVSDGETRRFGPGGVFLAEDTTGKGHQTRAAAPGGCVVIWVPCQ